MGSSVSVSDPESEDMVIISIFDIWSSLETKLFEFSSGSDSEQILKVSIIGDRNFIFG